MILFMVCIVLYLHIGLHTMFIPPYCSFQSLWLSLPFPFQITEHSRFTGKLCMHAILTILSG